MVSRRRGPRSLEEQWAWERRRREAMAMAAGLPTPRDATIGFCLALAAATIAGITTNRLPIVTIPLLIAGGFAVGLVTERAWAASVVGAIVGLVVGRDVILRVFTTDAGSFDRDAGGAVLFALIFVLPGWLLGRGVALSRRPAGPGRRSPASYVLTGIGVLVAVGAVALLLLSGLSRDY